MNTQLQPQQRQQGESDEAWAAYLLYRDLGPGRSLSAAYRLHISKAYETSGLKKPGKAYSTPPTPPGSWKKWRLRFDWDARTEAYDNQVEATVQGARTAAIAYEAGEWAARRARQREAEWQFAEKLRTKAEEMLQRLTFDGEAEVSPFGLAKLLEVSAKLGRLACEMETERSSGTVDNPAKPVSELTDHELEAIIRGQAKG